VTRADLFKLSPEQVNRLEEAGHLVDKGEERLKADWTPPPTNDAAEDEEPVSTMRP
jgi:hypothetical protein